MPRPIWLQAADTAESEDYADFGARPLRHQRLLAVAGGRRPPLLPRQARADAGRRPELHPEREGRGGRRADLLARSPWGCGGVPLRAGLRPGAHAPHGNWAWGAYYATDPDFQFEFTTEDYPLRAGSNLRSEAVEGMRLMIGGYPFSLGFGISGGRDVPRPEIGALDAEGTASKAFDWGEVAVNGRGAIYAPRGGCLRAVRLGAGGLGLWGVHGGI